MWAWLDKTSLTSKSHTQSSNYIFILYTIEEHNQLHFRSGGKITYYEEIIDFQLGIYLIKYVNGWSFNCKDVKELIFSEDKCKIDVK